MLLRITLLIFVEDRRRFETAKHVNMRFFVIISHLYVRT